MFSGIWERSGTERNFPEKDDLSKANKILDYVKTNFTWNYNNGIYAEKTARKYLNDLCEMQVLEKKTIEGKHYYLNQELYRILSEWFYIFT